MPPARVFLAMNDGWSSGRRYALMSVGAALATIGLKGGAFLVTGSVGLLSDALESFANLAAAVVALLALDVAGRPPDDEHAYGHTKAEYLSSGFEGALVVAAALGIVWVAIPRLITPQPIETIGLGLVMTGIASAINLGVGRVLLRAGRQFGSIALEADAKHLISDVITSLAIMAGVAVVAVTGWTRADPVIALLVAARISWTGVDLLSRSMHGLLDTQLPMEERALVEGVLRAHRSDGIHFHAFRTRTAGRRRFVSFHVLVPGEWTVARGHDLLELIEAEVRDVIPRATVFTHLEPIEDPVSWEDLDLERPHPPRRSSEMPEGPHGFGEEG